MKQHNYTAKIIWTGNKGIGTKSYTSYDRDYSIAIAGKYNDVKGSADPAFRGDISKYNPEDLLLSSISACHMLWYLHLCAENDIVVLDYIDECDGVMEINDNGSGKFNSVTLNPIVTITEKKSIEKAKSLHAEANNMCFIANSCNFSISHKPSIVISN